MTNYCPYMQDTIPCKGICSDCGNTWLHKEATEILERYEFDGIYYKDIIAWEDIPEIVEGLKEELSDWEGDYATADFNQRIVSCCEELEKLYEGGKYDK